MKLKIAKLIKGLFDGMFIAIVAAVGLGLLYLTAAIIYAVVSVFWPLCCCVAIIVAFLAGCARLYEWANNECRINNK
ncbi:MAG: hypothetical protein EBU46_00110 [Nitrosomonadaceae bacterium]|nr:hypothetical protein [Nitrosomonadaceae bacterium]